MTIKFVNKNIEEKAMENQSVSNQKRQTSAIKRKKKTFSKSEDKLNKKQSEKRKYRKEVFAQRLEIATRGLNYISETDADIFPFIGKKSSEVNSKNLLLQIYADLDSPVEERDFESFFHHITKIQDWFDEERVQIAKNFQKLKEILQKDLSDLKVFNVGRVHVDVYVIGKDRENNLMGIKTKAIET